MNLKQISAHKCWGGTQYYYSHEARETACTMRFSLFLPPQAQRGKVPVLYWLSGLTCTEENFTVKAGAQRVAAELGLAVVACDTSPRGLGIPGEADSTSFGLSAGFYVDATQAPWSRGYRMYSYVTRELPALIEAEFPVDAARTGIFGHSMGGHGALVCGLRNPQRYRTLSVLSPIASATRSDWGRQALAGYLGPDEATWAEYDASLLLRSRGWKGPEILVDQGDQDSLLPGLQPHLLQEAAEQAGVPLRLRMQPGYDHGYFFVQTFIADHLRHHARHL